VRAALAALLAAALLSGGCAELPADPGMDSAEHAEQMFKQKRREARRELRREALQRP
jgi:hypothetical protein